jgi:hypothetical protein
LERLTVPKPTKKRRVAPKRKPAKRAAAKKSPAPVSRASATIGRPTVEEEAACVESLIESGEAARLDKEGKLPAGATHKIVEDEKGNVKVVRRRFSMA